MNSQVQEKDKFLKTDYFNCCYKILVHYYTKEKKYQFGLSYFSPSFLLHPSCVCVCVYHHPSPNF